MGIVYTSWLRGASAMKLVSHRANRCALSNIRLDLEVWSLLCMKPGAVVPEDEFAVEDGGRCIGRPSAALESEARRASCFLRFRMWRTPLHGGLDATRVNPKAEASSK